jgi:CRP/FNR family transcriptional regulator, polysaccharide utilization system transcription regulator
MKFNKRITCRECSLKCDIYKALQQTDPSNDNIESLHVYHKRHEIICKQGANVTHAIYLVEGTAKLYIEGLNNRNIILYIMQPHSYIGLLSFFETPKYYYSVMALEDSLTCMIDLEIVKQLYVKNHDLLINLNLAFGKSVKSIMNKIISLSQKQIRGRVAESLIYMADIYRNDTFKMHLTRKELGELSGISEENAVRILSEFNNEKMIKVCGREIEILDKKLLLKICECG